MILSEIDNHDNGIARSVSSSSKSYEEGANLTRFEEKRKRLDSGKERRV